MDAGCLGRRVSGKTVIDIGCGEGRFCRLLAKLGATVTGIDITEALIERARDLGGAGETYMDDSLVKTRFEEVPAI